MLAEWQRKLKYVFVQHKRKTKTVQILGTEYLQYHHSLDSAVGVTGHVQGSGELAGHSKVCPYYVFPAKQADGAQKQDLPALLRLHGLDASSILA